MRPWRFLHQCEEASLGMRWGWVCSEAGDVVRPALMGPTAYPVQCSTARLCPRLQPDHLSSCWPCPCFLHENPSRISLSSDTVTCPLEPLNPWFLLMWKMLQGQDAACFASVVALSYKEVNASWPLRPYLATWAEAASVLSCSGQSGRSCRTWN